MPSWRTCEWQQLLSTKSTTRYLPPNGTALTARSLVSTLIRSLPPPASTNAMTSRTRSPMRVGQGGIRRRLGTAPRQVKPGPARDPPAAGRVPRLPAVRRRDQVRDVQLLVAREALVVRGEEAVEVGGVVDADLLVAHPGAEGEVLAVRARAQGKGVVVPVLEAGAQVGGHAPQLDLAVEAAAVEAPRQVERPGQRVSGSR